MVVGVSIGSQNGLALATFPKGDEQDAVDFLMEIWMDTSDSKAWVWWPHRFIAPFYKPSIVDSKPAYETLHRLFSDRDVHRKVSLQAVNFRTGKTRVFTESLSREELIMGCVASCNIPTFFSPIKLSDGDYYVDGGLFAKLELA